MSIQIIQGRTNEELKAESELNLPIDNIADDVSFGFRMILHDINQDINQAQPQHQPKMEAP